MRLESSGLLAELACIMKKANKISSGRHTWQQSRRVIKKLDASCILSRGARFPNDSDTYVISLYVRARIVIEGYVI